MKTKHHQLGALLAGCLVFVTPAGRLHGAVNTFTNVGAWESAVSAVGAGGMTIFGFNFYPPNSPPAAISNQFPSFEFLAQDGQFPITMGETNHGVLSTPLRPNSGQTIRWRFKRPIRALGWERVTEDDTHIYRIYDSNNVVIGQIDFRTPTRLGGPVFGGFITDIPIAFASSFSDNNDQLHSIDNFRYAEIAPSRFIGSTWLAATDFNSFRGAADGWRATNSANTVNPGQYFIYSPNDGYTTGGSISVGETAGADGVLYFDAPAEFLGDKRKAYNGVLTFDLRYSAADVAERCLQTNDVIIAGTNVTVAYRVLQLPTTNWTRYEIPLTENVGWIRVGANRVATAEEMANALRSIQSLRIRAEWTDHSSYRADLDNVMVLGWPAPSAQPTLAVDTYAGITINGAVGHSYRIEYRDASDAPNDWKKLADLILPRSPHLFLDVSSPYASQRSYRVVLNE